ncbi:MAG TPA: permease-like cell division protein FtsX [Steroidobacteraceae bacterium]|nr:permease-like cell division protein FtsX [Steroidobacteraceae bacterium]
MSRRLKTWLARHAQTLMGSLGRIVQHPIATGMTVAVIAVALALPLFLNVLLQNTRAATAGWNQAFELSVYLAKKASSERAESLATQLRSRPDVAQVRVISADQALAEFRSSSGFGKALDALEANPLPQTLIVTPTVAASTPEGTQALKARIAALTDVDTVELDTEWVQRLNALLDLVRRVVWLTGGLLGLSVVLVVGNTIRLDILNRRAEIEVMKLVGATDTFARRPFLYSGVWYGLGGGLGAILVVAVAIGVLAKPIEHLTALYGGQFQLRGLRFGTAALILVGSVALGWLGSWIAATRHIRDVEPT